MWDVIYSIAVMPIEMLVEFIFAIMNRIFNNPGVAIIFVSITVQLLVLPMYKQADAMQEQERNKQKEMEPWIKHIKKTFKGDERFMMLQAYYKEVDYKPGSAIKGSFSLLLQIPFFMAAYNYLSNLAVLQGCQFLLINNLGKPDGLINIAGLSINVLPVLMTLFNIISGIIYTKGFPLKDKIQTYGLAAVFLVLLYDSPSGLVFYWMLNNLFSMLKNIFMKLVKRPRPVLNIISAVAGLGIFGSSFIHFVSWNPDMAGVCCVLVIICLLPLALSVKDIIVKRKGLNIQKKSKVYIHDKQEKIIFNLASILITIFMGLIIPISVVASSPTEFFQEGYTPIQLIFRTFFVYAGFIIVWIRIFYSLGNDKAKHMITCGLSAAGIIGVVDFYIFAKELGTLSNDLVFDKLPRFDVLFIIINTVVIIAVAVLVSFVFNKKNFIIKRVYQIGILTFVVLSATSLFTIKKETDGYQVAKVEETEVEPILHLSTEGKNVIVFMVDRAISGYIPYFLQEKPELAEIYDGFTYYPNTISFGGHTNFATPALFGGYEYTPKKMNKSKERKLEFKHNEALKMMPQLFSDNGYKVTVVDPPYAGYMWKSNLGIYKDIKNTSAYNLKGKYSSKRLQEFAPYMEERQRRSFICYSLMKFAPIALQNFIYNEGSYYSTADSDMLSSSFLEAYTVLENLNDMTVIDKDSSNNLLVLQNESAHEAVRLSEPDYVPSISADSSPSDHPEYYKLGDKSVDVSDPYAYKHYQVNMAALLKIGEWITYLKKNNVYDNTRIVIVSDHGYELHQFDYMRLNDKKNINIDVERFNALLMVKDFGETGFKTSNDFMTVADVPTLATENLINNAVNPYTGKSINSDDKAYPQIITTSAKWSTSTNNGYRFDTSDGSWLSVEKDIFDIKNWKYLGKGDK